MWSTVLQIVMVNLQCSGLDAHMSIWDALPFISVTFSHGWMKMASILTDQ